MAAAPSWLAEMKAKADAITERQTRQGRRIPRWDLQGKNAIISEGRSCVMRLLPRWDSLITRDGKLYKNPNPTGNNICVFMDEHWWDTPDGKRARAWCPRSLNRDAQITCPICDASDELRGSRDETERKAGAGMRAKGVFLFNAVLRDPKTGGTVAGEDGLVDIRYVVFNETLYKSLADIVQGGEAGAAFARGDVSDLKEGSDLQLTRPASNVDRWKAVAAANMSPLFHPKDNPASWANWPARMPNLLDIVAKDMKTSEALYLEFHGVDPEQEDAMEDAGLSVVASAVAEFAVPEDSPGADMDLIGPADVDPTGSPIDMPGDIAPPLPPRTMPSTARTLTTVRGRARGR